MDQGLIAMFGEAEQGEFRTAYYVETLPQLADSLGNPPPDSKGLHYAVQSLMYKHALIFFRVKEEGFSREDYFLGLEFLRNRDLVPELAAVCLPGMGDADVLEASRPVCDMHHSMLITCEPDLYDFLTYGVEK